MDISNNSRLIKSIAAQLGFDFCGIARAEKLDEDARRLESWLQQGMHGSMHYMSQHFEKRIDPTLLVPEAKSVVTLLLNYFPEKTQPDNIPKIASYAYGEDYHDVIKKKLHEFFFRLREKIGDVNGRGFVDSAPVLERSWAQKSGLGWIGKNGNLINKQQGSYFFIASLIIDLELEYDSPIAKDYCGTCTKCIDHCPTDAILPNKVVDGSKCISYFTIELKDALIPGKMKGSFDNWLFGCDVCQQVCPWNRFSKPNQTMEFTPIPEILEFTSNEWENLTEEAFNNIFNNSPIKRTKFTGIKRNLRFINNLSDEQ